MPVIGIVPQRVWSRVALAAALLLGVSLTGCQTVNGLVYGFERDVDTIVAAVDRATADLLPASGPAPQQPQLTHVDFPDEPSPHAVPTRFGRPRHYQLGHD